MRKVRAVVEIMVPDKVEFTERDFAKQLRRQGPKSLNLMPRESANRPLEFKEFGRVVQYSPSGARIVPPTAPKSFEWLVLRALSYIMGHVGMKKTKDAYRQWSEAVGDYLGVPVKEEPEG